MFTHVFPDTKHRSASLLARSIRLKLVGDETSEIPKSVANMTVSIQAIATFQALNDYLRPRLSGGMPNLGSSASRLGAMLALASVDARALLGSASRSQAMRNAAAAMASANSLAPPEPAAPPTNGESSSSKPTRRRSQRLSAKVSGEVTPSKDGSEGKAESSAADAPPEDDQSSGPELEAEVKISSRRLSGADKAADSG